MSGYVDGNYANAFLTENVISYPFIWPNNSNVAQFALTYVQFQNAYVEPTLGSNSADAPSAYLVEKGPIQKIGAGVLKFQRVYCQLPVTWNETQQMAYTFPGLTYGTGATWTAYGTRSPITLYAIATVAHTFTVSATPPTLDNTFIVTDGGNVVDYIGVQNPNIGAGTTSPASEPISYNVTSESRLIKGLFWEKISATVPKPI